ncbi:energy transducer TonB [Pedobacter sp. ASV28]|uniref:energy transducer TonB n=1 Tax=Pedobacter sp. ASV28 TaxID=2795123 RepID=UPI0018EBB8FE|nr:energy transducer TonB [Pedobacter sp. ASV28]
MKPTFLFIFLLIYSFCVNAQKKKYTFFFKDNGVEVQHLDSADYIRNIEAPAAGEFHYRIEETFRNGIKKLDGRLSSFSPNLIFEGLVYTYYRNGGQETIIKYVENKPVDTAHYFFANGAVQKQVEYLPAKTSEQEIGPKAKLVYQADSLGKVYVKGGYGHLVEHTELAKDTLVEEGDYEDGFKYGRWTGKHLSGKSNFVENYVSGKLIEGVNTVDDSVYKYKVVEVMPQFEGGLAKFYKYLSKRVRYPDDALRKNISGVVVISFIIEKDGRITEANIIRSVYPSIDKEAIRVILSSPKWIPGIQRGLPVRVKYNIPLTFGLGFE